jgi:hypothetical protein
VKLPFNITWQGVAAGVIVGIFLAPQIQKVPIVNRIPSI